MSLEDTLERPASAPLADPAPTNWVTIGTCPQMASMNNYPIAVQRNGVLAVYSGGDGGNTVLTSPDDGVTWNPPQTGDWPVRRALSGALHDGKVYIVGGFSPGKGFGDTLVSEDGLHFTQAGPYPSPWGVRWAHTLLSAGATLLMIAGVSGPDYSNEVWALGGDDAWTRISHGQFTKRAWAAGAVLGSKLLVIGGWNDTDGAFAETLVSADGGVTWSTHKAPFTPRHSASAVTIGDTVYLVGGCTGRPGTTFYNDTWATRDGVLWTRVDDTFGPNGRTFATADLAGRIGVIGSSANVLGLAPPALGWSELGQDVVAGGAHSAEAAFLAGKYWAWGGTGSTTVRQSDDARTWTLVPQIQPLPSRQNMACAVHNGKLFAAAGGGGSGNNEVYVSTDGASWTQVAGVQRFDAQNKGCFASFQGKLWLFGGDFHAWRSDDDGVSWVKAQANAFPIPPREPRAIIFGEQLWLIDGSRRESWFTTSGTDWTRKATNLPFSSRSNFRLNVVGKTLYLVRGMVGVDADARDVWATTDGANWQRLDAAAPYGSLTEYGSLTVDDAIIVFGGYTGPSESRHILRYLPPQLPPA